MNPIIEEEDILNRILEKKDNYYVVLGIERNTSISEIESVYRKLALKVHPDRNKSSKAHEAFTVLNRAYTALIKNNRKTNVNDTVTRILEEKDCYNILGINVWTSEDEINSAFKKLSREVNPDKNDCYEAHKAFIVLKRAHAKVCITINVNQMQLKGGDTFIDKTVLKICATSIVVLSAVKLFNWCFRPKEKQLQKILPMIEDSYINRMKLLSGCIIT